MQTFVFDNSKFIKLGTTWLPQPPTFWLPLHTASLGLLLLCRCCAASLPPLLWQSVQRDDAEAAKVYEDFVKEFGGDGDDQPQKRGPGGGRPGSGGGAVGGVPFLRGGTVRPGQPPASGPGPGSGSAGGSAGPPGKKPGGRYIPSFMPPGMAAAMGKGGGSDGEAPPSAKDEGGAAGGAAAAAAAATAPKQEESVFHLPGSSSKGKPRAIDALLANLKR